MLPTWLSRPPQYRFDVSVMRGPLRSLPLADRAVFVVVAVLVVIASLANRVEGSGTGRGLDVLAVALLAAGLGFAALAVRAPATGALGALAVIMVWYGVGYRSGLINLPFLVAFYLLGATGDRVRQLAVGGLAVALSLIGMLVAGNQSASSAAAAVGWILAAVLFGQVTHDRRALVAELESRAARAEADRDREAERRVAESRLAIARDVHDVLAHTVSLMTVQAGVAQDALEHGRDGADKALQTIRSAGRDALGEIRALVSMLREGSASPDNAPAPRLNRLEELAAATSAAGVAVDVAVELPAGQVPDLVELTAYRVVQEGLTNVVRHAQARRATVTVRRCDHDLLVSVRDDGAGHTGADGGGFGLRGMRERIHAMGGSFAAGRTPEGGWLVEARIPVDEASPS
jgi:signal transduction histidine kinase